MHPAHDARRTVPGHTENEGSGGWAAWLMGCWVALLAGWVVRKSTSAAATERIFMHSFLARHPFAETDACKVYTVYRPAKHRPEHCAAQWLQLPPTICASKEAISSSRALRKQTILLSTTMSPASACGAGNFPVDALGIVLTEAAATTSRGAAAGVVEMCTCCIVSTTIRNVFRENAFIICGIAL